MAPILYLSAFIFTLAVACFAEIVSLRSAPARSRALAERVQQNPTEFLQPTEAGNGQDLGGNFDLLDIVLVASVDGKFHALNRTSGHTLWSMSSSASSTSISAPSTLGPLVRTNHDAPQEVYIIEPQSGDIYVMATPSSPLQRFPFSMSELVDMSPLVYLVKRAAVYLLAARRLKATLNSECPWDPFEDFHDDSSEVDLDELEGSKPPMSTSTEIYIGRTDYHISIHTRPLNRNPSVPRPPVQNLSFSTYGPNNQDHHLQTTYRRTQDDVYIQSLPNGEIISFKAKARGEVVPNTDSHLLWGRSFKDPIVAIFDVLRNSSSVHSPSTHPFVLLQPRPRLQISFQSAFIGIVEETGSLFAMSPTKFPLVVFGVSESQHKNPLIDGSASSDSEELPTAVDAITRAAERNRCDGDAVGDRRCLVGIRRLEDGDGHEGRMRRLLDGAPGSPSTTAVGGTPASTPKKTVNETLKTISEWESGKGNRWEAVGVALLLGVLSLWFASRKVRGAKRVKTAANLEEVAHVQEPPTVPTSIAPELDPIAEEPEESDREGEVEADVPATPGKKIRRKRGKKKKATVTVLPAEVEEKARINGNGHSNENANGLRTKEPNSPLLSSIIINSSPKLATTPSLLMAPPAGYGSHGTVVFQGSLQGRAVAVKRLLQDFVTLASREVSILQESDDHPNVIRYYYQEAHANFLYIALELCPASLADIVECPDRDAWRDIAISFDPKRALRQITSGLKHLHALKLVHRDIKPQNILVSNAKAGKNGYRMLISDFGLCKKLDVDQTSFLPTAHGAMAAGTVGWRAPEILRGDVKLDEIGDDHSMSSRGSVGTVTGGSSSLTKSVDIFALGCLFYYTLTNGSHPYGDRFEREVNILKNATNLDGLERFGEEGAEAVDLISKMLNMEASERPDTTTCLLHPFFWDPGRRLTFLQDASDRFEIMCRDPKDPYLLTLEKDAFSIVGNDWHSRLDKIFIDNLGKFRKYDGRSVQDLLRALRNKKHHYQDLPDNVKRHLGPMPEGFLAYFTRRYPRLFLHVHSVIGGSGLRTESMFRAYFELPD
ncbi:hypothetical protein BD779DRAFT_1507920 [Infundibulicybe gibba]|nr:hypothetical protein BD779DRAFT_1507920 [Infundibulicybe gibba]